MTFLNNSKFISTPISIFINPWYIVRNSLYKIILRHVSRIRGDCLDVGCGSKPYESLFTEVNHYVGIDVNPKCDDADVIFDGVTIPFPDNYFDSVVSFEVFEHVFCLDILFNEVHRVLRPGGMLLFSVPFGYEEHGCPSDFARYTSFGLTHLLSSHNFQLLCLDKTNSYILAICQLVIGYIYTTVLNKSPWLYKPFLLLLLPLNVIALVLDFILPKRYDYFSNIVVLAIKPDNK